MRRVYLACDHGGFDLKEKIKFDLIMKSNELRIEVIDLGTDKEEPVDYPDYADLVCKKIHGFQLVSSKQGGSTPLPIEVGILVCGSGQGMAMRANKYSQVRAALVWSEDSTRLAREHNDANVLCLGGRLLNHGHALKFVNIFLTTQFAGDRHTRRVMKVSGSLAE